MQLRNIKLFVAQCWNVITTLAGPVAALLVLFIIVVEWLVTLNSLWIQRMGP